MIDFTMEESTLYFGGPESSPQSAPGRQSRRRGRDGFVVGVCELKKPIKSTMHNCIVLSLMGSADCKSNSERILQATSKTSELLQTRKLAASQTTSDAIRVCCSLLVALTKTVRNNDYSSQQYVLARASPSKRSSKS